MLRKIRPLAGILVAVLGVALLAACQSPKPSPTPIPVTLTPRQVTVVPTLPPLPAISSGANDTNTAGRSTLRVISALKTPLNVYLEGGLVASNLDFGVPTASVSVAAGQYTLRVFPVGSGLAGGGATALSTQPLTLADGQSVVIVLAGTADKPTLTPLLINGALLNAGQVRLAFAHFLPDSTNGVVTVNGDAHVLTTLAVAGQLDEIAPQSAALKTLTFAQGATTLVAKPVTLSERQSYLALLLDAKTVVLIGDATRSESQLRVAQVSANLGKVDVLLDDQVVATALDFGMSSDFQHVLSRTYTLNVFTAGADRKAKETKPLYSASIQLTPDQVSDIFLLGTRDKMQHAQLDEDLSPTNANFGRIMFVNAFPGSSALQVLERGDVLSNITPIDYALRSTAIVIPAGPTSFTFQSNAQGKPKAEEIKTPFSIDEGVAYVYVVTGTASSVPPVLLHTTVGVAPVDAPTPTPTGSPDGSQLQVRFINAMVDNLAVDLNLNDKALFSGVKQGTSTAPTPLSPQTASLTLRDPASAASLATDSLLQSTASGSVTLIAVGTARSARILQIVDTLPADPSNAVLRVIKGSPNTPSLRVDAPIVPATASSVSSIESGHASTSRPCGCPAPNCRTSPIFGRITAAFRRARDVYAARS